MVWFGGLFNSRFSSGFLFARSNRRNVARQIPPNSTHPVGRDEIDDEVRTGVEDGSFYNLTTDILPPLGALSNRRVRLRRFVISPYDRHYRKLSPISHTRRFYKIWTSDVRNIKYSQPVEYKDWQKNPQDIGFYKIF